MQKQAMSLPYPDGLLTKEELKPIYDSNGQVRTDL
jgi:hypothetical protein